MGTLPPHQIPPGLSWAAADVKKTKTAVRAFENRLDDLISEQKPRFDELTLDDEEAVTFYVIPTPHGLKNLDAMKNKIRGIELGGLTWEGVREVDFNNPRIKKQLKLAVKIKGPAKIKNQLYKAIEGIGDGSYVMIIENLHFDEEEEPVQRKKKSNSCSDVANDRQAKKIQKTGQKLFEYQQLAPTCKRFPSLR